MIFVFIVLDVGVSRAETARKCGQHVEFLDRLDFQEYASVEVVALVALLVAEFVGQRVATVVAGQYTLHIHLVALGVMLGKVSVSAGLVGFVVRHGEGHRAQEVVEIARIGIGIFGRGGELGLFADGHPREELLLRY